MKKLLSWVLFVSYLLISSPGIAETSIGIGFFAPEVPIGMFDGYSYLEDLAKHLQTVMASPVKGYYFKDLKSYERAIREGKLSVAILGGFYLAVKKNPQDFIATAKLSAHAALQWTLMSRKSLSFPELKNKKLQLFSMRHVVERVIQNGLLWGNVGLRSYFRVIKSPNLNSAVEAVWMNRADVVFAPQSTKDLKPIFKLKIVVPPPAIVKIDKKLSKEILSKLGRGLFSFKSKSVLSSWEPAASDTAQSYLEFSQYRKRPDIKMALLPLKRSPFKYEEYMPKPSITYEYPMIDFISPMP